MIKNIHSDFKLSENDPTVTVLQYEPKIKKQSGFRRFLQVSIKWFANFSTIALGVASFAPDTLGIPPNFRPWVFVTFVFWFLAFCSGVFSL